MTPAASSGLLGDRGHLPDGPAEDRLALLPSVRPARPRASRTSIQRRRSCAIASALARRRSPRRSGRCPGVSDGPTTAAPAPSPKHERGAAVVAVDEVGQLLDADDEDVLGRAAADQVVGRRDAVAVAGAGGGDVEGRGAVAPSRSRRAAAAPASGRA